MIKKILISIILIIFSANSIIADEIKKIIVDGNKRITDDTIIVFSGVNLGSQVTTDDLNNITKNYMRQIFLVTLK
tara:strand:+ start:221 stop:445 length:225 start_codon:yes stop_codon:yes gene_type:complete